VFAFQRNECSVSPEPAPHITTYLDFSRWVEVFGDPNLTTALLDRVTHRAKILVFNGSPTVSKRASFTRCRKDRGYGLS
jgi:DNA replication protein DnaC